IADFVADKRASTPSNAAELAVPEQKDLLKHLQNAERSLTKNTLAAMEKAEQRLKAMAEKRVMQDPMAFVDDRRMYLDNVQQRIGLTAQRQVNGQMQRFTRLAASLDALSPLKVLGRGFAMAQTEDGTVLRSTAQVHTGDKIQVRLGDGSLDCTVDHKKE
ncbi:MAG: exodeoxyribonuclease VII large subunit, partial [Oscillospiraceae bacterium]|nr:exodeoxyribonuclease VII large subunit [Oscillospiraceae bacterium]